MNKKSYEQITIFFEKHPAAIAVISIINRLLTGIGFFAYPLLLLFLFWKKDFYQLVSFIIIPALCFFCLTFFRKMINFPRPYEKFRISPLIPKETQGKSFPSRHVFSMFLIAALWYLTWKPFGIFLFLSGAFLAVIRVIGGVHFIRDVIAGAFLGIFCGMLTLIFC